MKKFLATMLALVMALTLCTAAWAEGESCFTDDNLAQVGTVSELTAAMQELSTKSNNRQLQGIVTMTIELTADITFGTGDTWGDYSFAGNDNGGAEITFPTIVIDGNGHTIFNMPGALVSLLTYGQHLTVKDLTLNGSKVTVQNVGDVEKGAGAFINMPSSCGNVKFINCKLINAVITSGKWSGGFVGFAAGTGTITFENCAVENSTISGAGSTGGLMGHGMASSDMSVTVSGTSVKGNEITCTTANKESQVGALFGTVGSDSNTNATVSATVGDNTVKSGNAELDGAIYGRGLYGAALKLTGGSYDKNPLKVADGTNNTMTPTVSAATVATVTNSDNTVVSYNYGEGYVQAAAQNAAAGQTVTVTNGNVTLSNVPAGVKILAKKSGSVTIGETEITANNPDGYVVPCTVTFDADNGTAVTTVSVPYNTAVTAPAADPTKDGYTFKGWYNADTEWNFDNTITNNITLTAKWEQVTSNNNHHFTVRPTTDTTPKAESPKTFDAGIAVYGVMAVSSVLGMGYVGKKKF